MHALVQLMMFLKSLKLSSLFFLFSSSDWIILNYLPFSSLILCSDGFKTAAEPMLWIFQFSYCILQLQTSCWFFLVFSLSWYSHFTYMLFSWAQWCQFTIKFLLDNSYTSVSLGSVSGDLFCCFSWAVFPHFFLCALLLCFGIFHLKTASPSLLRTAFMQGKTFTGELRYAGSPQIFIVGLWVYIPN